MAGAMPGDTPSGEVREHQAGRLVVAISGEPAAGKTTAAALLAAALSGVAIDTDVLSTPLRLAALTALGLTPADMDGDQYQQLLRPAVYQGLVDTTVHLAQFGHPVIVNAPFHPSGFDAAAWAAFRRQLADVGAELHRIHLIVPPDRARTWIAARGEPRDRGKLTHWAEYRRSWDIPAPSGARVVVNDGTPDDLRRALLRVIPA